MATSVLYSIISDFNYFRPKGCCCFYLVSCVYLLHMGLFISTLVIGRMFGKPPGTVGDQWLSRLGVGGIPSLESGKEIVIPGCCHVFVLCCEHILFFLETYYHYNRTHTGSLYFCLIFFMILYC